MTRKTLLVLAIGWLAFLAYAYPGLMTHASYEQLVAARSGMFSDAHPLLMQAIWRALDYFIAGPFGLIVLQTSTFVAGAYLIARRTVSERGAAIAAVALLWFPPIGAVMAVASNDSLMAGLLMLGTGLVLAERRSTKVAGVVLLCFAAATRYHASGAVGLVVTHGQQNVDELRQLGIPTGHSWLQDRIGVIYESCSAAWLFRPLVAATCLALVIFTVRRNRERSDIAGRTG